MFCKKLKLEPSVLRVVSNNYFKLIYLAPNKQGFSLIKYLLKTIYNLLFAHKIHLKYLFIKITFLPLLLPQK